jgi:hypothetical protein
MLHRSIAMAIAVVAAALLLSSDSAGARSGGAGGGHAGAFGLSRPSVPPSGTHRFFPSPGAGIHFHNRHVAGERMRSEHRRFFRSPYWLTLPYGGLLYGSYDDMFGGGAGMETTNPSVEPNFLQSAIYRPACRLQTQIRTVPSENGGRREIAITRCIHPGVSSLARPAGEDSDPHAADGNRPDAEAFDITSATTVAAGLRESNVVRVGGCRSETRSVPAEGGGSRDVTITRC